MSKIQKPKRDKLEGSGGVTIAKGSNNYKAGRNQGLEDMETYYRETELNESEMIEIVRPLFRKDELLLQYQIGF